MLLKTFLLLSSLLLFTHCINDEQPQPTYQTTSEETCLISELACSVFDFTQCKLTEDDSTFAYAGECCPRTWEPVCGNDSINYASECQAINLGKTNAAHTGHCSVSQECPNDDYPVCGKNDSTYQNSCYAFIDGQTNPTEGTCYLIETFNTINIKYLDTIDSKPFHVRHELVFKHNKKTIQHLWDTYPADFNEETDGIENYPIENIIATISTSQYQLFMDSLKERTVSELLSENKNSTCAPYSTCETEQNKKITLNTSSNDYNGYLYHSNVKKEVFSKSISDLIMFYITMGPEYDAVHQTVDYPN